MAGPSSRRSPPPKLLFSGPEREPHRAVEISRRSSRRSVHPADPEAIQVIGTVHPGGHPSEVVESFGVECAART